LSRYKDLAHQISEDECFKNKTIEELKDVVRQHTNDINDGCYDTRDIIYAWACSIELEKRGIKTILMYDVTFSDEGEEIYDKGGEENENRHDIK